MRTDSIALLTYSTKPRGGVVHTLALAEALVELGVAVDVWSLGRGGDAGFFRPVDPRVGVHVVPLPEVEGETVGERVVRSISVLGSALGSADGYDVVHAQDCISANAAAHAGLPVVRTVHHLDHFTTPQLAACHERAIVTPYAHVCVSAAVAGELRDGWGLAATVIPNGVHAARFAAAADDVDGQARWRARLGRYVLTVGGIEPRKGSLELVEAFARLVAAEPSAARAGVPAAAGAAAEVGRRPGLTLAVAGGETVFDYRAYRAEFDARAAALGVSPVVLGAVPDDELPALVAGAAAFAFPSTKEGFGIAAMEALAAGVPLVVSDLPVLRETFAGAAAFADGPVEFAAALATALTAPDPARRAAGSALADRYTWAAAARAHLELYARLG